jgi:hypothetical protein
MLSVSADPLSSAVGERPGRTSDQAWGWSPSRVTLTSRRTAALDGRLLDAARAWRQ